MIRLQSEGDLERGEKEKKERKGEGKIMEEMRFDRLDVQMGSYGANVVFSFRLKCWVEQCSCVMYHIITALGEGLKFCHISILGGVMYSILYLISRLLNQTFDAFNGLWTLSESRP